MRVAEFIKESEAKREVAKRVEAINSMRILQMGVEIKVVNGLEVLILLLLIFRELEEVILSLLFVLLEQFLITKLIVAKPQEFD